jgi:hypothetical protein
MVEGSNPFSRSLGREFAAIYVIERHKSGEPHVHAIFDLQGLEPGALRRILDAWERRWGRAKGNEIVGEVARFRACTYVSKEPGEEPEISDIAVMREVHQLPILRQAQTRRVHLQQSSTGRRQELSAAPPKSLSWRREAQRA